MTATKRYITTHNVNGKPTFLTDPSEELSFHEVTGATVSLAIAYAFSTFPADLSNDVDLAQHINFTASKESFILPGGVVVRYAKASPGMPPEWHRTHTLDIGIVMGGEMELQLDGGETRRLGVGDIAVQRGTAHAWCNPSEQLPASMVFISIAAKPVVVGGKELPEHFGKFEPA